MTSKYSKQWRRVSAGNPWSSTPPPSSSAAPTAMLTTVTMSGGIAPARLTWRPNTADTAFAMTLRGSAELLRTEITAVVDGDLPVDDHASPVVLA